MTRVNTNLPALQALRNLQRNTQGLNQTIERLSSGFRLNRVSDGAADFVISERLRNQIQGLRQAVENSEKSQGLLNTADGALAEISTLLISVRELAVEAASSGALSVEEIQANQAQVDAAIDTIQRIAVTTKFGGSFLLSGAKDHTTSGLAASLSELTIHGANFGVDSQIQVKFRVTQSAQHGVVTRSGKGTSAGSAITLEIAGLKGTAVLTLGASVGNSVIQAAVNALTDATGVSAVTSTTVSGGIFFYSQDQGEHAFVSIRDLDLDANNVRWINARDIGRDAAGTVNNAAFSARGSEITFESTNLKLKALLGAGMNKNGVTDIFTITGGGLAIQVGDTTKSNDRTGLGIQQMTPSRLGTPTLGFLSQLATGQNYDLLTNPQRALDILDAAMEDVSGLRGRLGAFAAQTLEGNIRALENAVENLTQAESRLRDTDFAAETVALARNQILVQAGTSLLAQANLTPSTVLDLLGPG